MTFSDVGSSLPEIVVRTAIVYLFLVPVLTLFAIENVHIEDIRAAIRAQGLVRVEDVRLAVLETDSSMGVFPISERSPSAKATDEAPR